MKILHICICKSIRCLICHPLRCSGAMWAATEWSVQVTQSWRWISALEWARRMTYEVNDAKMHEISIKKIHHAINCFIADNILERCRCAPGGCASRRTGLPQGGSCSSKQCGGSTPARAGIHGQASKVSSCTLICLCPVM